MVTLHLPSTQHPAQPQPHTHMHNTIYLKYKPQIIPASSSLLRKGMQIPRSLMLQCLPSQPSCSPGSLITDQLVRLLHFPDKIQIQRGEPTCPRSHSKLGTDSSPKNGSPRPHCSNPVDAGGSVTTQVYRQGERSAMWKKSYETMCAL